MALKDFMVKQNATMMGHHTVGGYLGGPSTFVIDPAAIGDNTGTVQIKGNLQVDGTNTTINSTTLDVDDLNITVAKGAGSSSAANGAGLTVDGAGATILYTHSTTSWDFNKAVNVTGAVTATSFTGDGSGLTGLSSTIASLTDVDVTGIANNKILKYDSTSSKWEISDEVSVSAVLASGNINLIKTADLDIQNSAGTEQIASFAENGSVTLYYDNSAKVSTITSGIRVTGDMVLSSNTSQYFNEDYVVGDYNDTHEVTFTANSITADRTISFPDITGTILLNLVEDTTPQLGGTLDANGNTIDMGANVITDTKVGQWDTAYGWGDHASAGYQTSAGIANLVEDTTPQLGGNLDVNDKNINFGDSSSPGSNNTLTFGNSQDLKIYHSGTQSFIWDSGVGQLRLRTNELRVMNNNNNETMLNAVQNGAVTLYYDNAVKLATTNTGVDVTGSTTSETLISTIATGTAPLTVASTTKVANLNADKLDDKEFTDIIAEATALAIALG